MIELRRNIQTGNWAISGTQSINEYLKEAEKEYDITECIFCEGNETKTPLEIYALRDDAGWSVRVIPAIKNVLKVEGKLERYGVGLYDVMNNIGAHEIIIESPRHIKNLSGLDKEQIMKILKVYQMRISDLKGDVRLKYPLIFKTQLKESPRRIGHIHSHLFALPFIPAIIKTELMNAQNHFLLRDRCMFCDMISQEIDENSRIVDEDHTYICIVPFSGKMLFEVWIIPKHHNFDFTNEDDHSLNALASMLKRTFLRFEKRFDDPAISFVVHTAPYARPREGYWKTIKEDYHWHIEIYPQIGDTFFLEQILGFQILSITAEDMAKILKEVDVSSVI